MDAKGGFVVVWQDDKDKNGLYQIMARGFNADGSQRFHDMTVNSVASGQQLVPDIAMARDGSFVVVWQDDKDRNRFYQIRARGFNANGSESFSDITVNSNASGQQLMPVVCVTDSGGFVVSWEDDINQNNIYQIYARGFDQSGKEEFADRAVNRIAAGQQLTPVIASHRPAPRRIGNDPGIFINPKLKWMIARGKTGKVPNLCN
jgi:hypothetical protein